MNKVVFLWISKVCYLNDIIVDFLDEVFKRYLRKYKIDLEPFFGFFKVDLSVT